MKQYFLQTQVEHCLGHCCERLWYLPNLNTSLLSLKLSVNKCQLTSLYDVLQHYRLSILAFIGGSSFRPHISFSSYSYLRLLFTFPLAGWTFLVFGLPLLLLILGLCVRTCLNLIHVSFWCYRWLVVSFDKLVYRNTRIAIVLQNKIN